jgi:predicted transcriptional regulator
MRLTPDQIIAGIPARALRDCFKKLQGQGFGLQALAKQLSLPAEAAAAAVGHLLEAGLIAERQSNTKDKKGLS